jgi:hypothetical protein
MGLKFYIIKDLSGQDSFVGKALDSGANGAGFDPRLDYKRRST